MSTSFAPTPLASIAHIEMGQSPDSSTVLEGDHGGVPFLQGNAEFGTAYPTPRFTCTAPMKMCRAGDILMSVRAPVGAMNIADRDYCIGRGLAAIRVVGMPPTLAAHMVSTAVPALRRVAQGTTFEAISKTDLASAVVKVPPQEDREPLWRILDTLDTTIRQTEAIIEKLKQVKQGLLHDLLTRGIDANGELRPPQSQAPHLYKDSPLGWIPREWEALPFSRLAEFVNGNSFDAGKWANGGLPIIRIQNLNGSREFNYYSGPVSERWHVLPGDLLFAWSGQRGISFGPRLWSGPEGVLNQHIFKVLPRTALVSYRYLFEILRFRQVAIEDTAHGFKDSFLHVKRGDLGGVHAGVPRTSEQSLIISRIQAFERCVEEESAYLGKYAALKAGLMDDLLTGRVRVTPLFQGSGQSPSEGNT